MTNQHFSSVRFGDIRVDFRNFKVFKGDVPVSLEPKTFTLLTCLIENRERLVEKRELLDTVWKDVTVTENALTREIGKLRRSLGDDPKTPKYIETVHTRGYRFIAQVESDGPAEAPTAMTGEEAIEERASESAPEFALAAIEGPGRTGPRISKWLPYKVFVGLSVTTLLVACALLLRQKPEKATGPAPGAGMKLEKMALTKSSPEAGSASGFPGRGATGSTTLAILPFQSLGAPEERYMGLAIADALITKLSNSRQLAISPLSTILHYADSKQDSLAIGRAMQVDYVLEGKYQKQGDHTRVTVQLLCIPCNGASRWAGSFDEVSNDFFHVQDSISKKVAAALPVELTGEEEQRIVKRETNMPEAQLAVSKGKLLQNEDTKEALEKSIEHFQLAVSRDPSYAAGWALLADSYRRMEWYGGDPAKLLPLTREAAQKANTVDDKVAYAHSMLGAIAFQYDWDFATAEREYRRARELQHMWVHQWYARMLLATNRASEAESEYKKFVSQAPFSVSGGIHYAEFLYLMGQYSRAIELVQHYLSLNANYPPAHELLGLIYEQQQLPDQAEQEFKKAAGLSNGLFGSAALGHLYATKGKFRHTQDVLDDMRAHRKDYYISPFEFAVIHAGLGYKNRAIGELEQAYREHSLSAQSLRCDPRLENLRHEPRYQEFAKRLGVI